MHLQAERRFQWKETENKERGAFWMLVKDAGELIGNTPLVEAARFAKHYGLNARLLVKAEYLNPAGSVKDRVAKEMIEEAERTGRLMPGSVIIEPTSGNTGIGLAFMAAIKGYRVILTMPETMSVERRKLLAAYGAEIVLTSGTEGMQGAVRKAEELEKEIPGSFLAGQFYNPANPAAHYKTTGPEIYADTEGKVDIYVATAGTGGTLSGTAKYLRERIPKLYVAAVEPAESPLLSGGKAGAHKIQGIGANFIPEVLDTGIYDEVLCVSDEDAFSYAKTMIRTEGLLVGISSGAALAAAVAIAKRTENEGKTIVAVLPDSGDRYLSTELFGER